IVLLAPTFLMGGTLPVLTRFFTKSVEEVETEVGVLYALNTFGAAAGTMAAALIFIPGIGNIRTTLIIATLNVAIGVFAVWMAERGEFEGRTPEIEGRNSGVRPSNSDKLVLLTLAL